VLETARSYAGTPYRYGGTSRTGIDCSGLVCNAFQAIDWKLPHSSQSLAASGTEISQQQIFPGNLVFFSAKNTKTINHVGIVNRISGGQVYFLHATVSGGVREDNLANSYWRIRFRKAIQL
jgi:cell wall-associated NlpC family hydrolase